MPNEHERAVNGRAPNDLAHTRAEKGDRMKGLDYETERTRLSADVNGNWSSLPPSRWSEFDNYISKAIELVCKAHDYPLEGDGAPLGYRFDGYHHDGFTFTVFFRIDKDCPFMVRFDGVEHYAEGGTGHPLEGKYPWVADSTMIVSWEV